MQNIAPRSLWAAVLMFSTTVAVAAYPTIEDQMYEGENPFDWWILLPLALSFYVPVLLIVAFRQRSLRAPGYFAGCARLALSFSFRSALGALMVMPFVFVVWIVLVCIISTAFPSAFEWSSFGSVETFAPPAVGAVVLCLWGVWRYSDPKASQRPSVKRRPSQKEFWDEQRVKDGGELTRTEAASSMRYVSREKTPNANGDVG